MKKILISIKISCGRLFYILHLMYVQLTMKKLYDLLNELQIIFFLSLEFLLIFSELLHLNIYLYEIN